MARNISFRSLTQQAVYHIISHGANHAWQSWEISVRGGSYATRRFSIEQEFAVRGVTIASLNGEQRVERESTIYMLRRRAGKVGCEAHDIFSRFLWDGIVQIATAPKVVRASCGGR